jgi:acyl-CoA reductase-like NAD-dependent aldehyde dehydrogenase
MPMFEANLFINGASTPAARGATFERRNPLTGEVATRAAAASADDVRKAIDAAAAAFPAWAALTPAPRRQFLMTAAAKLRERANEIAAAASAETGATTGWGQFNVHLAAMMLEEAGAITTQIGGEVIPSDSPGTLAMAVRRPAGVVIGMAPWNAPVILAVRAIATPLACGNTVVLKSSETCPQTHRLIADAFADADFPPGVVNVVSHSAQDAPQIVEALIAHPAVRRVSFTGSTRVGCIIGELCGRHLKPVVLELGGKAPMVVLEDADLDEAAKAAVFGAFMNQGQICMSTERIIVDKKIADDFVARFKARTQTLRVGDPRKGDTPLGAVVDERTVATVRALIDDAVQKGAKVATGGTNEGVLFEPTIVDHVTPQMKLFREESFGPIVAVTRVNDVEDAIAKANDTDYGLSSAVFGRDIGRALSVAERIESGICHINGPTVHDEAQMPFGGVKSSGFGRFGGKAGIDAFTELRWITVETQPKQYPI